MHELMYSKNDRVKFCFILFIYVYIFNTLFKKMKLISLNIELITCLFLYDVKKFCTSLRLKITFTEIRWLTFEQKHS